MVDERVRIPSYYKFTYCASLVCLSASTKAHLYHCIVLIHVSMEKSNNLNFTIQLILIMKFASLFLVLLDIYNFFNEVLNSFAYVMYLPSNQTHNYMKLWLNNYLLYSIHTCSCRILNITQSSLIALTQYLKYWFLFYLSIGVAWGLSLITWHVALLRCSCNLFY